LIIFEDLESDVVERGIEIRDLIVGCGRGDWTKIEEGNHRSFDIPASFDFCC